MAAKKDKTIKKDRKFLNPKTGLAAIEYEVGIWHNDSWSEGTSWITISDCSRRVTLEFDASPSFETKKFSKRELNDKRKKVEVFRKMINDFCDATLECYDECETFVPEPKPKKK